MRLLPLLAAAAAFVACARPVCAALYRIDTWAGGGMPADGGVGDGQPATRALLDHPSGLARGPRGLYIADHDGGRIRRVRLTGTRVITTVAGAGADGFPGDGVRATTALLVQPTGV